MMLRRPDLDSPDFERVWLRKTGGDRRTACLRQQSNPETALLVSTVYTSRLHSMVLRKTITTSRLELANQRKSLPYMPQAGT